MAATQESQKLTAVTPDAVDRPSTPASIGYGHPEYNFVQGLMELQKSVVRIGILLKTVLLNWSDVLPASHHALTLVNSPFMFTGILIDYFKNRAKSSCSL